MHPTAERFSAERSRLSAAGYGQRYAALILEERISKFALVKVKYG
jgi:hypothetical protein